MIPCGVHTGILFSRKRCDLPAAVHCGRCRVALCKQHIVAQDQGPFLCPRCDRYVNDRDHDWDYDERRGGWRWRGSRSRRDGDDEARPAAASAAGAASDALGDEDRAGFERDEVDAEAADVADAVESDDADFDAS